ncbi:MAG: glycosyltransferase family 2 protein [Chthonomonas sp.]|nr:glycosyltransferase family 2 protein [Chthonomonas sp.]
MKVSVIVPAYNAEAFLHAALESAWNQTIPPDEIIVASDGSTDGTANVARGAGARVLELPKGNGAIARNAAAKEAIGERLFFLDADDLWVPTKIERHLAVGAPLILDNAQPFTDSGESFSWLGGLPVSGELPWRRLLNHKAWPSGSGFSVLREAYWGVGGFNPELTKFQDVDFWVRCAAHCGTFINLPEVLTRYRIVRGSVSKVVRRHEQNLETMLSGWDFAADSDKKKMRALADLLAAEFLPWPDALRHLVRARSMVANRYYWKCVLGSLRRTIGRTA